MNTNNRLLIADDYDQIRGLLVFDLQSSGYITDSASDCEIALKKALENNYDLIILDVMMPKINGYDVCKNIRMVKPKVPVLMLTAKGSIQDKTEGFDCGGDYYLVKPFESQEVLLRIRALLGRNNENQPDTSEKESLRAGDIEILSDSLEAIVAGKKVKLTPTEFEILYCLMQHLNKPVSLAVLLDEVWGYGSDEDVRMVRVHVGGLRQKIENDSRNPKYLHTVTNVGYKLTPFGSLEEE